MLLLEGGLVLAWPFRDIRRRNRNNINTKRSQLRLLPDVFSLQCASYPELLLHALVAQIDQRHCVASTTRRKVQRPGGADAPVAASTRVARLATVCVSLSPVQRRRAVLAAERKGVEQPQPVHELMAVMKDRHIWRHPKAIRVHVDVAPGAISREGGGGGVIVLVVSAVAEE